MGTSTLWDSPWFTFIINNVNNHYHCLARIEPDRWIYQHALVNSQWLIQWRLITIGCLRMVKPYYSKPKESPKNIEKLPQSIHPTMNHQTSPSRHFLFGQVTASTNTPNNIFLCGLAIQHKPNHFQSIQGLDTQLFQCPNLLRTSVSSIIQSPNVNITQCQNICSSSKTHPQENRYWAPSVVSTPSAAKTLTKSLFQLIAK